MPRLRTILAVPVLLALLLAPTASGATSAAGATETVLPRLTGRGKAPAAALPASSGTRSRYTAAGHGIARTDHFRAGSVTKTFIATVVLQLASQHRLSLSDPVERYLPGLLRGHGTDGRRITLRVLLSHTSGLPDFAQATRAIVPLTPLQAVHIALTLPPARAGRFSYSSTNYVLLGLVIRRVTGRSYADEARRRIITPLRLTGTSFPGSHTTLPSPHGRAFSADGSDVTRLDPRVAGAAGRAG